MQNWIGFCLLPAGIFEDVLIGQIALYLYLVAGTWLRLFLRQFFESLGLLGLRIGSTLQSFD